MNRCKELAHILVYEAEMRLPELGHQNVFRLVKRKDGRGTNSLRAETSKFGKVAQLAPLAPMPREAASPFACQLEHLNP